LRCGAAVLRVCFSLIFEGPFVSVSMICAGKLSVAGSRTPVLSRFRRERMFALRSAAFAVSVPTAQIVVFSTGRRASRKLLENIS